VSGRSRHPPPRNGRTTSCGASSSPSPAPASWASSTARSPTLDFARAGDPHRGRLVARVRELAPREEIERRYDEINRFEQSLADGGTTVIKCFLHISYEEQRRRLLKRLDRPEKLWKFSPSDIDDRALWPAFQEAYAIALERCSTSCAPWYVIPSDHKWYRNWAVGRLLLEHLRELDPRYPKPGFDVAECWERLLAQ
jgi:hypothetical protein